MIREGAADGQVQNYSNVVTRSRRKSSIREREVEDVPKVKAKVGQNTLDKRAEMDSEIQGGVDFSKIQNMFAAFVDTLNGREGEGREGRRRRPKSEKSESEVEEEIKVKRVKRETRKSRAARKAKEEKEKQMKKGRDLETITEEDRLENEVNQDLKSEKDLDQRKSTKGDAVENEREEEEGSNTEVVKDTDQVKKGSIQEGDSGNVNGKIPEIAPVWVGLVGLV